ncbi:MAG: hypothetical protein WAK17_29915 [Candidatus Nitrosopolaris sp.]
MGQKSGPQTGTNRLEFTSGGSGIGRKGCCGVGTPGTAHAEVENWSPGAKGRSDCLCDASGHGGKDCNDINSKCYGGLGPLYGKQGPC